MHNMIFSRKIDSLGRLVIPKEYRDNYNINESDYLQLVPLSDGILLKKYSKLNNKKKLLQQITDIVNLYTNVEIFICDKETILAYSGLYKDRYINKRISNNIKESLNRRESLFEKYEKNLEILDNDYIICTYINETIISNFEEIGIIYIFKENGIVDDVDLKVIKIVSSFLSKYLEE